LESDPGQARAIARRHISRYLDLPNYTNNWRRLGFTDDDLVGQGSDRLVDALVAWGDVEAVSRRVKDHLDAGADHVCVQVFDTEPHSLPLRQWGTLAMAML
jgi:probable F420-dependent oxidoreductase